ncbi:MAG: hypothetical protein J6T70_15695 [Bacteroidales bacterium]|nr:hypothetical protein [Bacteroidales bacterium]
MKKNKIVIYSVIVLLVLCNVMQLFSIQKIKTEKENTTATLYPYVEKYSFLQSNIESIIEYSARKIADVSVCDKDKRETSLSQLFDDSKKPLFILRISERYCNSCVESFVNLFANGKINKDFKFIYLTGFNNPSRIAYNAKELGIDENELYNVQFLDAPIDNAGFPYMMVLDKDLTIKYCYFPVKGYDAIDIENINMILDCYAKIYK